MESKVFVKTFSWLSFCLIYIYYSPFLVGSIMRVIDDNWLSFNILSTTYIKNFSVLNVNKLFTLISEDLEPPRVGAPNLHISSFTSTLDVPRLVVVSCSNGKRLLMEIPNLGLSSIGSFNDHVSVVNEVKVSVLLHLRYNIEVFVDN